MSLLETVILSPVELEQLTQLLAVTWDGNVISKSARDSLVQKGLATRCHGFQIATQEGLCYLHEWGVLQKYDQMSPNWRKR